MIYDLYFDYWDDDPQNDDSISVAVYSSYDLAKKGLEKFKNQPRFKGKEEFFYICEYRVNEEYDFWSEGYYTEQQSDNYIVLSNNYVIKKYADDFLEVIFEKSEEVVFKGTFHFYEDTDKCILLKNVKNSWMYSLNKENGSVTCKTRNEEKLLNHMKEFYQLNEYNWNKIDNN